MLSKKKIIIIIALLIVCLIGIIFMRNNKKENDIIKSKKEQIIISSNAISMMYETEVGSGEYQASTDTSWPSSGYIFNERLSKCENGGTLSWNNETNRVIMQTNTSDKCYVYFDKYEVPMINNVSVSKTYNSISLTVDATKGNNDIVKYYYSNNDGASYVNSTSSSYTFSGLTSNLEYKIKVYVEDSLGYTSSVYESTVTTNSYTNPSISNVTTSNITTDSITLNVTASGGTNSVATYYYSKDNGSSYVSSTSSSYTFSGLSAETTYNFKVYVKDSAGYSSGTKNISATTDKGLITFYVNRLEDNQVGITVLEGKADYGMTWEEWVASEYNTSGGKIGCASGNLYYLDSGSFDGYGFGFPIAIYGENYTSCEEKIKSEEIYFYDDRYRPDPWM